MTPDAIRIVSRLRQEFYALFAEAMTVSVSITGEKSYASNLATASWTDSRQQSNYVYVYAYSAPDDLFPERPLILRLSINKGVEIVDTPKFGKNRQGRSRKWYFELTLLPEEVLDFLPWIVDLVQAHDRGVAPFHQDPPHQFDLRLSKSSSPYRAQTQKAVNMLLQQRLFKLAN